MKKLVVIGNGMAGARVVEEILARDPQAFEIVMFGAEPYGNYNRILLSNILNQTQQPAEIFMNPLPWYLENNIRLHAGVKAVEIDRQNKKVAGIRLSKEDAPYGTEIVDTASAEIIEEDYDYVILATGSRPFVPPFAGADLPGVFVFRTIDDCDGIAAYAKNCRKAAVIGGGLLGLEAARGLMTHDVEVTVIEAGPQLMQMQLDSESGDILKRTMEGMGVRVLTGSLTAQITERDGKVGGLLFKDGSALETDMVVVSAGIRPITEIAKVSRIDVNRGIVCDDQMRTSDPEIFAVGECVEHREKLYGLVEPIWEQARVLADVITGKNPDAAYEGSRTGTKLKVMGVELVSMGQTDPDQPDDEVLVYRNPNRGIYKKLLVRDERILGAILLGDAEFSDTLMQFFMSEKELPENRSEVLFAAVEGTTLLDAADLPDGAQICNCNGVCKKTIVDCIVNDGATSVAAVGAKTKAGKGCGSCRGLIAQLIESAVGEVQYDASEHYYVPGVPLEKSQLIREIRDRKIKSVSEVFAQLCGGREHADSKVGLASLLKTVWPKEYEDERDARFINDRVHANIQKDGTFSVVPRIYGGVTSAEDLLRIANAAVKYNVKMVKFTGGQRIDLLGVKKEDLPGIWKDIGIPSGHAYTKAFRTCKSCVGTDFCRFGLGDSITLSQRIEIRYQGMECPHKVKMAVTGCPRNCAEAYVKDVGVVAIEGDRWEIYIGGAAGSIIRKGDLMCTVDDEAAVIKYVDRFLQYYREHAKYLERTYGFVERIGVDVLKGILIEDSLGICAQLEERMQEAVEAYRDPWAEADVPAYINQFQGPQLVEVVGEVNNNG
ncbi:MAG: nitrite reductase large subunit NirB [Candidatus Omnitrophica bacterium]|nr:nitrite reductase large subunit NirB [Candidatus Omnitrophota bacterium]MCB9719505.1 NAD(P)/FAD-dependent oxidoreductase [Candidatus Omnitrophota bacterium]